MKEPVKNLRWSLYPKGDVTQWFGENKALYAQMNMNGHNGIDIVRPWGESIYAVEDGIVGDVKDTPDGYGKHVRIISPIGKDGIGNEWVYGHNSANLVKIGDKVKAGDEIAKIGNTGFVVSGATPFWKNNPYAGTHLHLGKRQYKEHKEGWRYSTVTPTFEIISYNNGFFGSVDFFNDFKEYMPEDEKELHTKLLTLKSLLNQLLALLLKSKS
jgi:murein DD-endopeptidase MepM/ murein hydrolase activator NlpD